MTTTTNITIRKADDRGHVDLGWLDSRHSFSFGHYHDPRHMGFGPLRVINDDRVAPGGGFPTHPHSDMEIITYVLDGVLAHKDSLGNGSEIRPGDVQRMSAGTGIRHSEFNGSRNKAVRLLQIWITPDETGLPPSYEQKAFSDTEKDGRLRLVASPDGRDGSVHIHRDVDLYAATLSAGQTLTHALSAGRTAWLQVARGTVTLNGTPLHEGDGAAIDAAGTLRLEDAEAAEILLFDIGG